MLKIYEHTPEEKVSTDLIVTVNGKQVPVLECYVSAFPINRRWPGHQRDISQREKAYFISFEGDELVDVKVKHKKSFSNVFVRPLSKNVQISCADNECSFNINNGFYAVEFDNSHNPLHIFYNKVKKYDVDIKDVNTLYLKKGVYNLEILKVKSNQTIYIEEGAIVYGCIHGENVENVRICGRGILDNSKNKEIITKQVSLGKGGFDVGNSIREHTIKFVNSKNIVIEGITIRDSLVYNVTTWGCENVTVDDVKIIGCWRYNTDGIDFHNSSHCKVTNCFVRTFDDSICVKGHLGYTDYCEDILVDNCVIWNDWGHALEIGTETNAKYMHDITFRNCDIIHVSSMALDIFNVDYGEVFDVFYENINIEFKMDHQENKFQHDDETTFEFTPFDGRYLPWWLALEISKHEEHSKGDIRGKIHDITYDNVNIISHRMPPMFIRGYSEDNKVYNINFKNVKFNGKRVDSLEEFDLFDMKFYENIKFK